MRLRKLRAYRRLPLLWVVALLLAHAGAEAHADKPEQVSTLELLLPGVWRGVQTSGYTTYHLRLEVRSEGERYVADGMSWTGMTEAQAQAALRNRLSPTDFYKLKRNAVRPTCIQQSFTVSLKEDMVTFQCIHQPKIVRVLPLAYADKTGKTGQETNTVLTQREENGKPALDATDALSGTRRLPPRERNFLLNQLGSLTAAQFVGRLIAPGLVAQDSDSSGKGIFRLWREDALAKPQPLDQEKGVTLKLACLDGTLYHYTCYLPKSYAPGKPTPVLINSSPSGNAEPLSVKMAEQLGWIMVGLTESQNGPPETSCRNRDAVLFDLRRRFNIDLKHVYFAGFSGGARVASLAALSYPDFCAGLLCIGASCKGATPPPEIPIYFLAGETDMNREEVSQVYTEEKRTRRKTEMALHPGGHSWGRPEDHEAALRWLASVSAH